MKKYSFPLLALSSLYFTTSFACSSNHSDDMHHHQDASIQTTTQLASPAEPAPSKPSTSTTVLSSHADVSSEAVDNIDQLIALAAKTSASAPAVYPIKPVKMQDFATVFPTVEMKVVSLDGNKRMVTVSGYQMEGAESVIYLGKGQRSILAAVTEKGQKQLKLGKFSMDDYGNKWRTAELTGMIESPVLDSNKPLWKYAEKLDTTYCSTCHAKVSPKHFTVNSWGPVAKSMGARTNIAPLDLQILTKFFESNAKDVVVQSDK
ncbi:hypothetical protein [Vibrio algicola]|uniref:Cytochrome C n=1 Tax=Vibrio algicola TaxID=2662262 RepID=A0A5Q0TIU0_9VIBR|nr:hypothetical protein [Vibrio algicola]